MADARRLIGIDLAWVEGNCSGCVELVWDDDRLKLTRLRLICEIDDIVKWIDPERGEWIVAVDAPLVIRNADSCRPAEREAISCYNRFDASARPTSIESVKQFGAVPRGGELLRGLERYGATLVEGANDIRSGSLVFETYPHIAMVELFHLAHTIKYKKGQCSKKGRGGVACQHRGQKELVDHIRRNLCGRTASPRLSYTAPLDDLLRDLDPNLGGEALKGREDKLDGLICAYAAAWLDAGRDLVGLGEVGEGVMIAPRVQGIGPLLS